MPAAPSAAPKGSTGAKPSFTQLKKLSPSSPATEKKDSLLEKILLAAMSINCAMKGVKTPKGKVSQLVKLVKFALNPAQPKAAPHQNKATKCLTPAAVQRGQAKGLLQGAEAPANLASSIQMRAGVAQW